jgi:hypothetical protein
MKMTDPAAGWDGTAIRVLQPDRDSFARLELSHLARDVRRSKFLRRREGQAAFAVEQFL